MDQTAWLTFDAEKPGCSVLAADGTPFHDDVGGSTLSARFGPASAQATGALGVLLLHHHNAFAARAESLTGRNSAPSATIVEPAPGAASATAGLGVTFRAVGTDPDAGDTLGYSRDFGDGRTATGAVVERSFPRAGAFTVRVTVTDGAGATASAQVVVTVAEPRTDLGASQLLPVVLDARGVGGAAFTTELTLVSRAAVATPVLLHDTASVGSGSGWASVALEAGQTRVITDVVSYLRTQGLPIPDDGSNQVGTLQVLLDGATSPSDFFVGGRTSTPGDGGSSGLFYSDAQGSSSTLTVAGLQENDAMRSNLAVLNGGSEPVTGRVRLEGPLGEDLGTLPDAVLPARGWTQYDRPLLGKATAGRAIATRVSGTSSFSAYGVLNDAGTSDGSYVPPLVPGGTGAADRMIPVVLDVQGLGTSRYATELTLANLGAAPLVVTLACVATAQFGGGSGSVPLTRAAGEQRILPDAISFLRAGGLALPVNVGDAGPVTLRVTSRARTGRSCRIPKSGRWGRASGGSWGRRSPRAARPRARRSSSGSRAAPASSPAESWTMRHLGRELPADGALTRPRDPLARRTRRRNREPDGGREVDDSKKPDPTPSGVRD